MHELTSTSGVIAVVALALAVIALGCALWALRRERRIAAAQRVVLGTHGPRDLVRHAEELQAGYTALHDYVEDVAHRLEARMAHGERGLRGAVTLRGLVRYDAYDELSGHQSTTIALLDETHSGIVLSSIHHRDQARLYVRLLDHGTPDIPLSPEEVEAVKLAISGGNPGHTGPDPAAS